jgi:hypothetical protein
VGRTPRILKSDQQPPKLYQELWETILAGDVFRGVLANRKKNGQIFYAEKTITPLRDADGVESPTLFPTTAISRNAAD